jgi:hypothetical protein
MAPGIWMSVNSTWMRVSSISLFDGPPITAIDGLPTYTSRLAVEGLGSGSGEAAERKLPCCVNLVCRGLAAVRNRGQRLARQ